MASGTNSMISLVTRVILFNGYRRVPVPNPSKRILASQVASYHDQDLDH
jgi:hypothetical protein